MSAQYKFTLNEAKTAYEFVLTVEAGKKVEFGLDRFAKGTTANGMFIDITSLGTSGNANAKFIKAENGNNITCSVAGSYKVVYNIENETVDFYAVTNA